MNEQEKPELSANQAGDEKNHVDTVKIQPASTIGEPVDELEDSLNEEENFDDEFNEDEFDDEEYLDDEDDEDSPTARARALMEELFEEADLGEEMSELDVLTLEEAADYLKVEYGAIRRLLKEKGLPGRKIGDEWRFLRGAIAEWLFAPGGSAPAPVAPERFERTEQRPERRERRESTQRPRSQDRHSHDEEGGSRYPRQEGRYPQQSRPPRRPRFGDEGSQGEQGGYPPPRRPRYQDQNQQNYPQGEYRPPRRNQFGGGQGQGGYSNEQSGNRSSGGSNYEGKRFQGGPKKPKRKALNEQRFKRLDRRKFGDGTGPAGDQESDADE